MARPIQYRAAERRAQRARTGAVSDRAAQGAVALARARQGRRGTRDRSRRARVGRAGAGRGHRSRSSVALVMRNAEFGMRNWLFWRLSSEWGCEARTDIPHFALRIPH